MWQAMSDLASKMDNILQNSAHSAKFLESSLRMFSVISEMTKFIHAFKKRKCCALTHMICNKWEIMLKQGFYMMEPL